MLAVSSLVITGLGAGAAVADVPPSPYVVADASDWVTQAYENLDAGADLDPSQTDVTGPARAPFGTGSHQMTIGSSTVQTELYRTAKYDGVQLSALTRLEYSTFAKRTSGTGALRQPTYLRLNLDTDGVAGVDHSVYFYPADNADQQAVANGVWQNWDVAGGKLSVDGDGGAATTKTLAEVKAMFPDAVLENNAYTSDVRQGGAIALINGGAGGGNNDPEVNGTYDVDRVIVGAEGTDTLFDFGGNSETNGTVAAKVVDPEHLQGWAHQAYDNENYLDSDQTFVKGPGGASGAGSLRFSVRTAENAGRVELFRTRNYDGTLVRDLRTLDFSTFQRATGSNTTPQQPVYARLSVDTDGDGGRDETLYYYPGNNGDVQQSAWQTWHAAQGKWNVDGDTGPADAVTLADYAVQHPDATIVVNADPADLTQPQGGVAFIAGGAGATQQNGEYYLDDITVKTVDAATGATVSGTKYALEPSAPVVGVGPAAGVGDVEVAEGNKAATLNFHVNLSTPAGSDVTVSYATADGTAKAGKDYDATSGTVTIPAGSTSATVPVTVLSDLVREADETLSLTISAPSYGTLGDATATGTILNDDTRVGISLAQGTRHRVKLHVDTLDVAAGAPVKVYRVTPAGRTLVLSTDLNSIGQVTRLLAKEYAVGAKPTFVATVRTDAGLYTSREATITIRR